MLVRGRGDRRNLRDDAMGKNLAMARVIDVHRVVIERRHRRHHAREHRHRVRVVLEAVEESQQRFVDHRVVLDGVREFGELLGGRQLPVDQQVRHFQEVALLGQLLDRVAPVQQHTVVAIDESNFTFARRRGHEARVERKHAVFLGEIADAEHIGPERAALHFGERLLAGRQIGQFKLLFSHDDNLGANFANRCHRGSLTGRFGEGASGQAVEKRASPSVGIRSSRLFASAKIGGADLHVIASESSMETVVRH